MLPMGWNQIRQARVADGGQQMQPHNNPQHHPQYGHLSQLNQQQMMMQNQQPYDMYQQQMMQSQHQQMFPHQIMGNYGMQNQHMMMASKPPEPNEPPPPSPPAPLPKEEAPPTPPAVEPKWWVTEMQKLPTMHHKHELERLACEKWFQNMNTNQQIECWQHKLQLINKQKKAGSTEIGRGQDTVPSSAQNIVIQAKPSIVLAPSVSAPSSVMQNTQQTGDLDKDLQSAREEEKNIRQQVKTFERQYGEWKKQFDDWKDKHKAHPNKDQFAQYETQWMTWQTQMSSQKKQYDDNLSAIQLKINNLEQQNINSIRHGHGHQIENRPRFQGSLLNQDQGPPVRFDSPSMNNNQGPRPDFNNFNNPGQRQNFNPNQDKQFDNNQNRFQRPGFGEDSNQNLRFANPGNMGNNSFQQPTPRFGGGPQSQNSWGQRPRFSGNQDDQWQKGDQGLLNPSGPRLRNRIPPPDQEQYGNDEFEQEKTEDDISLPFPLQNQRMRGPRPDFGGPRGPRFNRGRGGPRNRFDGPRQRHPRHGGLGENNRFRGPRPRFPGQNLRFPGPRGPRLSLDNWADSNYFGQDEFFNENEDFFEEEDFGNGNNVNNQTAMNKSNAKNNKGMESENDWKVSRDMVPMSFGVERRKKSNHRLDSFTMHNVRDEEYDGFGEIQEKGEDTSQLNKDINPENDYSHYENDEYTLMNEEQDESGRDLGDMLHMIKKNRGRGRGAPIREGRGRGRGRGRGGSFFKNVPEEDIVKPPHVLMKEKGKFNEENLRRLASGQALLPRPNVQTMRGEAYVSSSNETPPPKSQSIDAKDDDPVSTTPNHSKAIMQKAKELSNLDIKNLLSAVKSLKGSAQESESDLRDDKVKKDSSTSNNVVVQSDYSDPQSSDFDELAYSAQEEHYNRLARDIDRFPSAMKSRSNKSQSNFDESAYAAREDHYDRLAREFDNPALRGRNIRSEDPLTEAELVAAGLDPVSLGLRDEDLLLQEYLLDPTLRMGDRGLQDPLLNPIVQDSILERELLVREMREREAVRRRTEIARQEAEFRQQLAIPILQAQKIVETIDYSHGLKKKDDKASQDTDQDIRRCTSPRDNWRRSPGREDLRGDSYGRDRMYPDQIDRWRPQAGPNERMMMERMWPPRIPDRERSPFDPSGSVVVAEEVVRERESMERHRSMLDREKESMERKRNSVERRRSSFDQVQNSKEREEERNKREKSLERLRNMERELMERERILSERERRLKTPPKKSRDFQRSRDDWKPEGGTKRSDKRSPSPIRRRFEEQRTGRSSERRYRSRSRSPVGNRGRGINIIKSRRSPLRRRDNDNERSGRGRDSRRSPDFRRGSEIRDRRRFTSPSGDASITRSPSSNSRMKPPNKAIKLEAVMIRAEDLLNDPARQRRPKRIAVLLRGLPGSGKSHIAKIIRDHETSKGVTPRVLGLDDYFMVENEIFQKDADSGKIVKRKVHEYEYEAAMEPSYRESLLKAFKKTLEDGFFSFVIVDSINDKVSYFSDFWTVAKKSVFEVYVADLTADVHACAKRNIHKRSLGELQALAKGWEETPPHMIRLDVRQMLQDSEIQEVEMGDISDEEAGGDAKKEKLTIEQMAGVPQSKWELMEANERLDKLDGIKKKKLQSSQQEMADFLSVTDDYVQRSSAPGKKRVRWADIEEKSTQRRMREVGFVVGNTDWSRMLDGDTHANKALNRTKFI